MINSTSIWVLNFELWGNFATKLETVKWSVLETNLESNNTRKLRQYISKLYCMSKLKNVDYCRKTLTYDFSQPNDFESLVYSYFLNKTQFWFSNRRSFTTWVNLIEPHWLYRFYRFKKNALCEARTHDLQIMRLTR